MYLLCIVVFSVKRNQYGSDAPCTPPSGGVAGMSHWGETRTRWRDPGGTLTLLWWQQMSPRFRASRRLRFNI